MVLGQIWSSLGSPWADHGSVCVCVDWTRILLLQQWEVGGQDCDEVGPVQAGAHRQAGRPGAAPPSALTKEYVSEAATQMPVTGEPPQELSRLPAASTEFWAKTNQKPTLTKQKEHFLLLRLKQCNWREDVLVRCAWAGSTWDLDGVIRATVIV